MDIIPLVDVDMFSSSWFGRGQPVAQYVNTVEQCNADHGMVGRTPYLMLFLGRPIDSPQMILDRAWSAMWFWTAILWPIAIFFGISFLLRVASMDSKV